MFHHSVVFLFLVSQLCLKPTSSQHVFSIIPISRYFGCTQKNLCINYLQISRCDTSSPTKKKMRFYRSYEETIMRSACPGSTDSVSFWWVGSAGLKWQETT
ncbi:hypothetical protein GOODEAATRI_005312 [Goodea atripinnis]|uniref:Secreted protein n=1 Tax=Goodea atripinnis TaxID=208336 RepID=A0ABV0MRE4_9TELE